MKPEVTKRADPGNEGGDATPRSLKLLAMFCPLELYEGIAGDLHEAYETSRLARGERMANRELWFSVVRFLRPSIVLRNRFRTRIIISAMISHFLLVAWRNALRSKLFSMVNVAGLSLGIAAAFMLFLHVRQELNYETHIPQHELIYRISTKKWAKVAPPLTRELKEQFPEAQVIGQLHLFNQVTLEAGGATVFPPFVYFADPAIFDVLNIPLLQGLPGSVLSDPNAVVISEKIAMQLFKSGEDPIGKPVKLNGYIDLVVSGVMKDQPPSTHLKIDALMPIMQSSAFTSTSRSWRAVAAYVRFKDQTEAASMAEKLREFEYKFYEGDRSREEVDKADDFIELEPIASIHLNSHKEKEAEANSDMMYIYIFSTFGVLIILIASINFINLFTAQAVGRAKEIGVRKVIGAGRVHLMAQFFGEAFLMVTVSGIAGVGLAYMSLPLYNEIATIPIDSGAMLAWNNLGIVAILVACTALLSGAYPAVSIASSATTVQSGGRTPGSHTSVTRKSLVAFQFIISMFLLITAGIVLSQLDFLQSRDLGFNKSEVIAVKLYGRLWLQATDHRDALRDELLKYQSVKEISVTDRIVGERFGFEGMSFLDRPKEESLDARHVLVDERFLQTMGIELLEGENFSGQPDSIPAYLFNATAARLSQMDNLVGRRVKNIAQEGPTGRIVGVVNDFNFASLHTGVDPLVLEFTRNRIEYLLVRVDASDMSSALQHVELTLKRLAPGATVSYSFLDDRLEALYFKDYSLYRVARIFSVVTVIIAVLGLFALSAHAAEARTKEVSIRKVLGASAVQVVAMLSRDFLVIVSLSLVIAIPMASYAAQKWLTGFNYRIDLHWAMFAVPVGAVALLAMLAVWIQSSSVANSNPADNLKHE